MGTRPLSQPEPATPTMMNHRIRSPLGPSPPLGALLCALAGLIGAAHARPHDPPFAGSLHERGAGNQGVRAERALPGPLVAAPGQAAEPVRFEDPRAAELVHTSRHLVLVPAVIQAARRPLVTDAQLMICNALPPGESLHLERFRLLADGDLLYEQSLDLDLPGDPRFSEVNAWIERLPEHLTHLHRPQRLFAHPDAPTFSTGELADRLRSIRERVEELRIEYLETETRPYRIHRFWLPLDQLLREDEPPGRELRLDLEVDYRLATDSVYTATSSRPLRWLGAPLGPPASLSKGGRATATVHAGDLHVHSCHGEALNACAPSEDCPAETLQTAGSFTYAELKSQYQALGYDWFTATDHSYCINDEAEYQDIVAECDAITDASFACMPDTELSSDEEGPQVGSDLGDALCLWTTSANHMGAHDISSRKPGGEDGILGFCDGLFGDALEPFTDNIDDIRAEGGYPIINHPAAESFAWNSFEATLGIEAAGMQGVEIWNGVGPVTGQGAHVESWIDWLLAGRVLYCYSGSDTHDEAFAFGANHVVLFDEALSPESVQRAVRQGRVFVSNGPALVTEVDSGPQSLTMGTLQAIEAGSAPTPLTIRAHYDFGADTGAVTLFEGAVGAAGETVLAQSGPLSGQGVFEAPATLRTDVRTWYRAYAENSASDQSAYANPVFFLPTLGDVQVYCTAKPNSQGCLPSIAWAGTPGASNDWTFVVRAFDVLNNKNGILFWGQGPNSASFQGGTLCVAPPLRRGPVVQSGGNPPPADCSGVLETDVGAIIRGGADPFLVSGATIWCQWWYRDPQDPLGYTTGLSNALRFSIEP